MSSKKIALSDFVELDISARQCGDNLSLHAFVNIDSAEVQHENTEFTVSATRMELAISADGASIIADQRIGILDKTASRTKSFSKEVQSQRTTALNGVANLKAGVRSAATEASGDLSAGMTGSQGNTVSEKITENYEIESPRVVALPNDRWEITELEKGDRLHGAYIRTHEALCHLAAAKDANRHAVTAQLIVRQRDLEFDLKGAMSKLLHSDAKLFKILVAKAISQGLNSQYSGKIILAEHEHEIQNSNTP